MKARRFASFVPSFPVSHVEFFMMRPFSLVFLLLVIVPLWRICQRAGFHGALSLLALIPVIGTLIVGAVLSFGEWRAPRTRANDFSRS